MIIDDGRWHICGKDYIDDSDNNKRTMVPVVLGQYRDKDGEKKECIEYIYKDVLVAIREGIYLYYVNLYLDPKIIVYFRGKVIAHKYTKT